MHFTHKTSPGLMLFKKQNITVSGESKAVSKIVRWTLFGSQALFYKESEEYINKDVKM